MDRTRQFSIRSLLILVALIAIGCWIGRLIKSALENRELSVIGPLFLSLHAAMLGAPIVGGWLGHRLARYTGLPSHYLGPIGVILGLGISAACYAFARHLVWEYLA